MMQHDSAASQDMIMEIFAKVYVTYKVDSLNIKRKFTGIGCMKHIYSIIYMYMYVVYIWNILLDVCIYYICCLYMFYLYYT